MLATTSPMCFRVAAVGVSKHGICQQWAPPVLAIKIVKKWEPWARRQPKIIFSSHRIKFKREEKMAWELTREAMKGHEREIEALQPFVAEIKDEKYERIYAKVIVSEDLEKLPDGEILLIQDFGENESQRSGGSRYWRSSPLPTKSIFEASRWPTVE